MSRLLWEFFHVFCGIFTQKSLDKSEFMSKKHRKSKENTRMMFLFDPTGCIIKQKCGFFQHIHALPSVLRI